MPRTRATLLIGLALVLAPACGRKGPLALPQGREPMPVEGLTAALSGKAILLRWTNPVKAVSGKPVAPLDTVEIWMWDRDLPVEGRVPSDDETERKARIVHRVVRADIGAAAAAAGPGPFPLSYSYEPPAPAPARLAFTVRVVDRKGRRSEFAVPVFVDVAGPGSGVAPPTPAGVS